MAAKIKPLKQYGQHFLRNDAVAGQIVAALACTAGDSVLEIGAGEGVLTDHLDRAGCARVIAVELDPRLAAYLRARFGSRVEVVEQDFLTVPLPGGGTEPPLKIVGNIPYYLTSDIIFKLLGQADRIGRAVLMVQKEVARRLTAVPGNKQYGALTVFVRSKANAAWLFEVGRENFQPPPKVDSAVIALDFNDTVLNEIDDYALFSEIVRCAFNGRRKMLRNSLAGMLAARGLATIGAVDLQMRPEALSIGQFVQLANEMGRRAKT